MKSSLNESQWDMVSQDQPQHWPTSQAQPKNLILIPEDLSQDQSESQIGLVVAEEDFTDKEIMESAYDNLDDDLDSIHSNFETSTTMLQSFEDLLHQYGSGYKTNTFKVKCRMALYFRYHTYEINDFTPSFHTWQQIADLLQIPSADYLRQISRKLYRNIRKFYDVTEADCIVNIMLDIPSNNKDKAREHKDKVFDPEIVEFCTREPILQQQASMSLKQRSNRIGQKFDLDISKDELREMYEFLSCKKKNIKQANKAAPIKQYLIDRRLTEKINLKWGLNQCSKMSMPMVFLDETTFILKDLKQTAWALPGTNVRSDFQGRFTKAVTMICAISEEKGVVGYSLFNGYLNSQLYLGFLDKIKSVYKRKRIGLFYDGHSVHKSNAARALMDEHNWVPLMNVAYQSDDNPIEYFFAYVKNEFRKQLAQATCRIGNNDVDLQMLVHKTMAKYNDFDATPIIQRCLQQLERKYQIVQE